MNPPSTFLLVEHFEHDAYQKNTFLMQNLDSQEKKFCFVIKDLKKNQIFL